MKIVETYRSTCAPTRSLRLSISRAGTEPVAAPTYESVESEIDSLRRQLRRATEGRNTAFDQGFMSCLRMAETGADLEQMRAAAGVVATEWCDTEWCDTEWCDTEPVMSFDEPTLVDEMTFVDDTASA